MIGMYSSFIIALKTVKKLYKRVYNTPHFGYKRNIKRKCIFLKYTKDGMRCILIKCYSNSYQTYI